MANDKFRKTFEKDYKDFLLSELIKSLMEGDGKSVRKLADEVGLSTTVIQNIRSGKQENIKLDNFINISHACGYNVILEKGSTRISL